MKYFTLAILFFGTLSTQAQNSTQAASTSVKEKLHDFLIQNFSRIEVDEKTEYQLSVIPNPVTNHLHVNSTGKLKKILLINSEGKVVRRVRLKDTKSFTIDTSSLGKGYFKVEIYHYGQKTYDTHRP